MENNKKSMKWQDLVLPITFGVMLCLCLYLDLFARQALSISNLLVNGTMFVIVGVIFLRVQMSCFKPINIIVEDLNRVSSKIHTDALLYHQFLWQQYKTDGQNLFEDKTLKEEYRNFLYEMDRISRAEQSRTYYRCDIQDYINFRLTDKIMHRNILNQIPGVMTGLGILGTFIGLSLGLQSFNTGTTAEITSSISPLMDGIKVAFHTSIYGMIFSLIFNFIYKLKIEEAENAIEGFVDYYKKYVLPDTHTDGINRQMEIMRQQNDTLHALETTVKEQVIPYLDQIMQNQMPHDGQQYQ